MSARTTQRVLAAISHHSALQGQFWPIRARRADKAGTAQLLAGAAARSTRAQRIFTTVAP